MAPRPSWVYLSDICHINTFLLFWPIVDKKNKVALVTGATSGIGEEITRELIRRGYRVIGVGRTKEKLKQLKSELHDAFIPMKCDVSNFENIEQASKQIQKKHLCPSLFFLNASVTGEKMIEHANHIDLNLHNEFLQTGYFGVLGWVTIWEPICRENGGANFILTSSLNAILSVPNRAAYCASKAAISKAFECLSMTYGNNKNQFSIVYPGPTETPGLKGAYPFMGNKKKLASKMVDFALTKKTRLVPSFFYHYIGVPLLRILPEKFVIKIFNSMQRI